jgi:hypothetical protein
MVLRMTCSNHIPILLSIKGRNKLKNLRRGSDESDVENGCQQNMGL